MSEAIDLSKVPTVLLKKELARRRDRFRSQQEIRPCDECRHFETQVNPREDVNPCALGHRMSFRAPKVDSFLEVWGFHRPGCEDYEKR